MLTRAKLAAGVAELARADRDLAAVIGRHGPPPLWARRPGFPTLVRIILEQQVSLASARATFDRLRGAIGEVSPQALLELGEAELRAIGFSRQKARYCRQLARAVEGARFDLRGLSRLSDGEARQSLMRQVGIGRWTADIYLLMALRRPDIWPQGDLALAKATQQVKRLRELPDPERLRALAESWRPWRAVAARVLWHQYLSTG